MIDFKSVSVTGAVNFGRVRALYRDNTLKLFSKQGIVMRMDAEKPVKRKGWINTHDISTQHGNVTLKGKCWTCGGWWRVAKQNAESLWDERKTNN